MDASDFFRVAAVIAFPIICVCMWMYSLRRMSQCGWATLSKTFSAKRSLEGKKINVPSARFPGGHYSGILSIWCVQDGFFLKPVRLFARHHPTLFLPWSSVVSCSEEKRGFSKVITLDCEVADIDFSLELLGSHKAEILAFAPHLADQQSE
jgi:hypothetical protein